jgi:uncharacterized GH25 family protein
MIPFHRVGTATRIGALAVVVLARAAAAHDVWLEPSSFRCAPGERLDVRLRVGEGFRGEPSPRRPERIERFAAASGAAERPILGWPGMEPAGVVRLDPPGTWLLFYDNLPVEIELPAERFELYLAEEGLEHIAELRRARGESARPARERYARSLKALVTVGDAAAAGTGFDRRLGLELELVPESDPRRLAAPSRIPFRLYFRGRPAPGVLVTAYPGSDPDRARRGRTDAAGRVELTLEPGERWLVRAVHMVPAARPGADWESFWTSLSFDSTR